jgi:cellulose synthase/poly-beta-1,6-N-acetylglucosamine synthase-like glycosyltransferase
MIAPETVSAAAIALLAVCVLVLTLYAVRHYVLTLRRLGAANPRDPMELTGFVLPTISVLVPMHNEERVAAGILTALVESDYDHRRLQVLAVEDRSTDRTAEIVDEFARQHPFITVLHKTTGPGGKGHALELATKHATGEILLLFDADYVPTRSALKQLVVPFCDPQVGAVMGRVMPENANASVLAALLDLERAAGYQVGQQARQQMRLTPQFGGTVGGVRRSALVAVGGWNVASLTEDTDLTFRLVLNGWKVAYVNRVECYEEAPETWRVRRLQIARWASGHTDCFHRFWRPLLRSRVLRPREKVDALFVLCCYLTAPILMAGWLASLWLLLFAPTPLVVSFVVALMFVGFQLFGSQATFAEIGAAALLDRNRHRVLLLPIGIVNFFASTIAICNALIHYYATSFRKTPRHWHKTTRFRGPGPGGRREVAVVARP